MLFRYYLVIQSSFKLTDNINNIDNVNVKSFRKSIIFFKLN